MIQQLLAAAALAALALSSAQAAGDAWNEPYAEKTEALALRGDPARGEAAFVICQGCHRVGALGRSDGSYPRLAGQHASVLVKQLTDVRSGRRINPKMAPFSDHQSLSVQDIADIAAYLQGLHTPVTPGQGNGQSLALGERLYNTQCASCHGPQGEGDALRFFPRVAGQHHRYLQRESLLIRDGRRRNAHPDMVKALRDYTDADIDAVCDHMSRLPEPARTAVR